MDGLEVKVFYSWRGTADQADPEFGAKITWDIPLLEGYGYCFVENVSRDPGTHHFGGLDCPGMIQTIEEWQPQAILVYGWAFKTHLTVLRHFSGRIPVFFRGDSTLLTGGSSLRRLARKVWLRWVYRHVDHALFVGQRNRAYFLEHGIKEHQLHWVPHSVDNQRFSENAARFQKSADEAVHQLGIPADAFKLLFAAKLVPRKMPQTLIDAVIQLNAGRKSNPVQLIMAGEGPLRQSLEERCRPFPFIHFAGFRNQQDMPAVYRMGDVFVLPSSKETWGLAVNEAFACCRPAITSDRAGCSPDLILEGETGFNFECGNSSDLAEKIERLCRDRGLCRNMGANARKLIESWSTDKAAGLMAAVIVEKSAEYQKGRR